MASLWDYLLGVRRVPEPNTVDAATVAKLRETLDHQQGFSGHISALASRTALAPEDVMAEAVRFADRHPEAFHDFIYQGNAVRPARENATAGKFNNVVAMVFILALLLVLIVIVGSR
jgi:hypothetical protein